MRKLVGLTLVAVLAFALSGCTGGRGTPQSSAATPSTGPGPAVLAAISGLRQGNYTFTGTVRDGRVTGQVHLPSRTAVVEATGTGEGGSGAVNMLLVGPDRYVKVQADLGEGRGRLRGLNDAAESPEANNLIKQLNRMIEMLNGEKWLRVDPDKVKDRRFRLDLSDPDLTGASALLAAAATAQRHGDTITGTLDAVKAAAVNGPLADPALTTAGRDLPYTAWLDAQGRLMRLVVDVPAVGDAPAHQWAVEITGYGTATAQHEPAAGEVTDMPADFYDMLGGG